MVNILVCAEIENGVLSEQSAKTVTAAAQFGGEIDILAVGETVSAACEAAKQLSGVRSVLKAEGESYKGLPAETLCALLCALFGDYDILIAPSTTAWKNILPRFAAKQDIQPVTDIIEILDAQTFKRPIYAGNAVATVKAPAGKQILTVRPTVFKAAETGGNATVKDVAPVTAPAHAGKYVSEEAIKSERPQLTAAKTVVSGGRGLASKENFALIEQLADKLGAAVGASRAAVDAGYAPNDWQVGQTGKIVAPALYIAVAISGAAQHLAGMKDSGTVVAINKDPDAPIFSVADYGLVADLFTAVPELIAELDKVKG